MGRNGTGTRAAAHLPALFLLALALQVDYTGAFRKPVTNGHRHGTRGPSAMASARCVRAVPRCSIADAGDADEHSEDDMGRLEAGRQRMEEIFAKNETLDASMSATERLLRQLFPSSQLVGSSKLPTKFIFVDEVTCIGCTHCRFVAPNTFMLEDDYGRARVFQQGGDDPEKIDEAIECCPVECIHQVSHTELVRLEEHRADEGDKIQAKYWKSRLVGSEIGIPNVPNWWEPLMDSAQPAWAGMMMGEQSMSSLGFLGPPVQEEEVELDMWGEPIREPKEPEGSGADAGGGEECELEELDVCDLVDCADVDTAALAEQLERALTLDGKDICDVVDCEDVPRECKDEDEDEDLDGVPAK